MSGSFAGGAAGRAHVGRAEQHRGAAARRVIHASHREGWATSAIRRSCPALATRFASRRATRSTPSRRAPRRSCCRPPTCPARCASRGLGSTCRRRRRRPTRPAPPLSTRERERGAAAAQRERGCRAPVTVEASAACTTPADALMTHPPGTAGNRPKAACGSAACRVCVCVACSMTTSRRFFLSSLSTDHTATLLYPLFRSPALTPGLYRFPRPARQARCFRFFRASGSVRGRASRTVVRGPGLVN